VEGLKIALASDWFYPKVGGVETHIHELALNLLREGHEPHVFTHDYRFYGKRFDDSRLPYPVHRLRGLVYVRGAHVSLGPGALLEANRIYKAVEFDVTHVHSIYSPLAIAFANLSRGIRDVPVVATNHSLFSWDSLAARALVPMLRWLLQRVDVFIAVSDVVKKDTRRLLDRSLGERPLLLVPNAVDTVFWRPPEPEERMRARELLGLRPDEVVILAVGRMSRRKMMHTVPRVAADAARRSGAKIALVIVGEGEMWSVVLEEVARFRDVFSSVHVHGFVDRTSLRCFYWAADVLYVPSRMEAFSIVALEASATGVPVVGWRGSGVSDVVVDGVTGFLVSSEDEAAARLAQLASDGEARERMGEEAARRAQALFSWPRVIKMVVDAYREALQLGVTVDRHYPLHRFWLHMRSRRRCKRL